MLSKERYKNNISDIKPMFLTEVMLIIMGTITLFSIMILVQAHYPLFYALPSELSSDLHDVSTPDAVRIPPFLRNVEFYSCVAKHNVECNEIRDLLGPNILVQV